MDMHQKRKMRKEKKKQNVDENKSLFNVCINWGMGI